MPRLCFWSALGSVFCDCLRIIIRSTMPLNHLALGFVYFSLSHLQGFGGCVHDHQLYRQKNEICVYPFVTLFILHPNLYNG